MSKLFRIAVRKFAPFETAMQKIWDDFCRQTGADVQVALVPMDLPELHAAILESGGLKNGDWDIAHINTDWLYEAYSSEAIQNLNPFIQKNPPDDFPQGWSPSLLTMQEFDGKILGLPFHDGPECLIYRTDLFEDEGEKETYFKQYNRPLQPPQTWEEFESIARFFQRPEQNLWGTVFAGFPDGHNTVFDFSLQLWSRQGELVRENGSINIDTVAAEEALSFYRRILGDAAAIHPGSHTFESVAAGMAFARGEVAMMINWFGFASMCEVLESSQVKGKVDIALIPKGGAGTSASLNVYWVYAMGSGSRHKEVAYDFMRFATNTQNDKLLTLEGGIGCRLSTWHDGDINALVPYYRKLELLHRHAKCLPRKKGWAGIASVIDEVVLKTINSDRPIKEIVQEGQRKISLLDHD